MYKNLNQKTLTELIPYVHYNLNLPIPRKKLEQKLIELSSTSITEKNYVIIFGVYVKYSVTIIDDDYFQIKGPVGNKRLCLLTNCIINSGASTRDEVNLKLKMQPTNGEIFKLVVVNLLFIFMSIRAWAFLPIQQAILILLLIIFMCITSYILTKKSLRDEASKIIDILRHRLTQ